MHESQETRELIIRIASIIIEELKLEDITPESFDADMDLVDELGVDSMDLATVHPFAIALSGISGCVAVSGLTSKMGCSI